MVRYASHSGGQCEGSDEARDVIWASGPAGAGTVPFLSHLASLVCPSVCPLTTSKRILTTLEHDILSSLHLRRPSKPLLLQYGQQQPVVKPNARNLTLVRIQSLPSTAPPSAQLQVRPPPRHTHTHAPPRNAAKVFPPEQLRHRHYAMAHCTNPGLAVLVIPSARTAGTIAAVNERSFPAEQATRHPTMVSH